MESHFLEAPDHQCATCIFREDGLELAPGRLEEIQLYLLQGQQHICHTHDDQACRGGRDLQLQIFSRLGLIAAPTDEALRIANTEYLKENRH